MRTYTSALCWAGAILGLAVGNATGAIADETADTLFIVLPIVAWLSLQGRLGCLRRSEARS
jgi:hypothetical protein